MRSMRALLLEPDPKWLAERRRLGIDRLDEVWDGVLHVVPPPSYQHQFFLGELLVALREVVREGDLQALTQVGVFDRVKGDDNYREPDLAVVSPADVIPSGINGHAELVVEVLSPNDTSREKFDFYAMCRIPEYWIVHPITRAIEVYVLAGNTYVRVKPDADGVIVAPRFDLRLSVVDGPKLRIVWTSGDAEI
jgi:Uma2 family endonuclease